MAKSINSFLPNYEPTRRCIQADIGSELARKADLIRKKRKLTWSEVMTGLIEKFVEDLSSKDLK